MCAIIIIGLLIWQSLSRGLFRFASWEHPFRETGPIALTETRNLTPSLVPTLIQATSTATLLPPSPSPTRTVVTSTPTLNSFHTLETPIDSKRQFIIHRILDGESLNSISNKYGTTPKALRLVNYDLQIPLLTNSLIIIPVNQTDVSGLPIFEAYIVKGDVSVEDVARQLMVDPAVLEYYNALKVGQVLTADEWVLVPYLATATP